MTPTEQTRFRLGDDVTFQSMGPGEDTVLLSLSSGYLYTCNETTEAFLGAIDGRRTMGEIVDELADQYEVPREQLHADLAALADELLREKLIAEVPPGEGQG